MEERTLEELRKEINGKQVVWVEVGIKMDALLIWPPGGGQISVKPYGYEPEEIADMLKKAGFNGYDVEEVSKPEFCLSSARTDKPEIHGFLCRVADIQNEGVFDMDILVQGFEEKASTRHGNPLAINPSCPYG